MNIKSILQDQQLKEDKSMLKTMKFFINYVSNKELGFKPVKYTTGRKEKGLYIYLNEDKKPLFLSLEKYKDSSMNDEKMEALVKNLLISSI